MQRVQVVHPTPIETLSVEGNEYEPDENGRIEVQDAHLPHFQKHPHMFKIIGPEQVVGPDKAIKGPRPPVPPVTPKGLKPA